MARALFVYSTVDGQTRRVSERLVRALQDRGHTCELVDLSEVSAPALEAPDLIVLGASIRYGKHRPAVRDFIEANRRLLETKKSAFFSVNLVARKPGRDLPDTNPYVRKLLRLTSWSPDEAAVFAGKLDYSRYRPVDRHVIRLIMWLTDGPTDLSACVEFTDWGKVDRFAQRLLALLPSPQVEVS